MGDNARSLVLSEHPPSAMVVSVVTSVKALSVVTASVVAETIVAAPVVAAVFITAAVTCAMFTVGCGQMQHSGLYRLSNELSVPNPPLENRTGPNS